MIEQRCLRRIHSEIHQDDRREPAASWLPDRGAVCAEDDLDAPIGSADEPSIIKTWIPEQSTINGAGCGNSPGVE